MAEVVKQNLEEYKKKILPVNKGRLTLLRDLYFMGTTQRGYELNMMLSMKKGVRRRRRFC